MQSQFAVKRHLESRPALWIISCAISAITLGACGASLEESPLIAAGTDDWKNYEVRMVALRGYFPTMERIRKDPVQLQTSSENDPLTYDKADGCDWDFCTDPIKSSQAPDYYWCDAVESSGKEAAVCTYAHKRGDMLRGSLEEVLKMRDRFHIRDLSLDGKMPFVAIGFGDEEKDENSAMVEAMKRLADPTDSCTYIKKRMESIGTRSGGGSTDNYLEVAIITYKNGEFVDGSNGDQVARPGDDQYPANADGTFGNGLVDRRELLPENDCMLPVQ